MHHGPMGPGGPMMPGMPPRGPMPPGSMSNRPPLPPSMQGSKSGPSKPLFPAAGQVFYQVVSSSLYQ